MVSFVLAGLMEGPVFIEVLAGAQGAQPQDGFGAREAPPGTGHIHAVFDQMPARPFNDPRRNGHSLREVAVVLQIGRIRKQVAGADIHGFALCASQATERRAATHAPRHVAGVAPEDLQDPLLDLMYSVV